jgi:hypothetical protein
VTITATIAANPPAQFSARGPKTEIT